ncbi:MAG: phage holin family protein [Cyanobacteria bacterium P01_G01_bin.39]
MIGTFLTLLATALSLLVVDIIFTTGVNLDNFPAAMLAALVIGLFNSVVKPVVSVLSLPINILTLGAFTLVINGFCFWLASLFVPGFQVHGLIAFIVAPIILSFVNTFISNYFAEKLPQASDS